MKRRDLVRHLLAHGCLLLREGGRHSIWQNPVNGQSAALPRHTEVEEPIVRRVCKALGITPP